MSSGLLSCMLADLQGRGRGRGEIVRGRGRGWGEIVGRRGRGWGEIVGGRGRGWGEIVGGREGRGGVIVGGRGRVWGEIVGGRGRVWGESHITLHYTHKMLHHPGYIGSRDAAPPWLCRVMCNLTKQGQPDRGTAEEARPNVSDR